jgi:DNA polymerase-3 subunit beta
VTPEVGEYEEEVPIEYDGEKVEIAFNPDFMLDILRHIESEMVCFILKDTTSPGVIKPYVEAPIDNYVNVIMPIRL